MVIPKNNHNTTWSCNDDSITLLRNVGRLCETMIEMVVILIPQATSRRWYLYSPFGTLRWLNSELRSMDFVRKSVVDWPSDLPVLFCHVVQM
jgi:hypothetical protein